MPDSGKPPFPTGLKSVEGLVAACACEDGCPSCVGLANLRPPLHQDPDLSHGYAIPSREAALVLLGRLAKQG